MSDLQPSSREDWAQWFLAAVAESGLSRAEFGRRAGLSRNVFYDLSKGRKPHQERIARIEVVLDQQRRESGP